MPTERERLCCKRLPPHCVSRLEEFQVVVLNELILAIARAYRNDTLAMDDEDDLSKSNRYAAYRQFIVWQHGRLGAGNRCVIPSCCVWAIRDRYPDPYGQYTGFHPSRLE
ncbi:P2X purinoceptor 7-like [Ptychodera flava]